MIKMTKTTKSLGALIALVAAFLVAAGVRAEPAFKVADVSFADKIGSGGSSLSVKEPTKHTFVVLNVVVTNTGPVFLGSWDVWLHYLHNGQPARASLAGMGIINGEDTLWSLLPNDSYSASMRSGSASMTLKLAFIVERAVESVTLAHKAAVAQWVAK